MTAKNRHIIIFTRGILAVVLLAILDILAGGSSVSASEAFNVILHPALSDSTAAAIIANIRAPRAVTAILAGSLLALSGTLMQAIFRNPLADPHIMGVSSGAGLGAAVATLTIFTGGIAGGLSLAGAAFIGAILSSSMILIASARIRSTETFLIFGIMLGFIFSSITSILEYSANEESLKLFYSWSAGTFSNSWSAVPILGGALCTGLILSLGFSKGYDTVLFGEEYARLSGVPTRFVRFFAIASCSIMTGTVTAFCGPIGFIGIIAPHMARMISGTSVHSVIIPLGLITGAAFALTADIISQCASVPIPPGSTAALIGIPIIIYILFKEKC